MAEHTFNLGPWLSRLGLKGGAVPDVLPVVQPVQVVGDASLLVPSLLPATAGFGGSATAVAGQVGAFTVRSLSKGGTILRHFSAVTTSTWYHAWDIADSDLIWATPAVIPGHQMGPVDTVSVVTRGLVLSANKVPTGTNPLVQLGARIPFELIDLVYIPTGRVFRYSYSAVSTEVLFAAVIQDLPAAPGPE